MNISANSSKKRYAAIKNTLRRMAGPAAALQKRLLSAIKFTSEHFCSILAGLPLISFISLKNEITCHISILILRAHKLRNVRTRSG